MTLVNTSFILGKIVLNAAKNLLILLIQKNWMPCSDISEFDRGEYIRRSYKSILFELNGVSESDTPFLRCYGRSGTDAVK